MFSYSLAAEFNIMAKKMNRFAKRFANLCEVESSDESQFEIVGLEDENDDEIEVAPNWKLPRETVAKAGLSNTMNNRLSSLVRSLWDEETRKELTTKKHGKGGSGKKRVSNEEAKLIMSECYSVIKACTVYSSLQYKFIKSLSNILLTDVCYNLQAYKKLPLNEVKTVEDTMQAIGKKLAYDRYNVIRYKKQTMNKQTHVNEATLQKKSSSDDDKLAHVDNSDNETNEKGDSEQVSEASANETNDDNGNDSNNNWNSRDQKVVKVWAHR